MDTNERDARYLASASFMKKTRLLVCVLSVVLASSGRAAVQLKPADTVSGYLARLLLNEVPFPGESGWVSEQDTKDAMLSILWVLHSRLDHVPPGYKRVELAATDSDNLIDVITVGGEKGQCDGFYRDAGGGFVAVPRVHKRIDYLVGIAGKGKPGRFASLLNYGQGLADARDRVVGAPELEEGEMDRVGVGAGLRLAAEPEPAREIFEAPPEFPPPGQVPQRAEPSRPVSLSRSCSSIMIHERYQVRPATTLCALTVVPAMPPVAPLS